MKNRSINRISMGWWLCEFVFLQKIIYQNVERTKKHTKKKLTKHTKIHNRNRQRHGEKLSSRRSLNNIFFISFSNKIQKNWLAVGGWFQQYSNALFVHQTNEMLANQANTCQRIFDISSYLEIKFALAKEQAIVTRSLTFWLNNYHFNKKLKTKFTRKKY